MFLIIYIFLCLFTFEVTFSTREDAFSKRYDSMRYLEFSYHIKENIIIYDKTQ